jgi:hypothetical protein
MACSGTALLLLTLTFEQTLYTEQESRETDEVGMKITDVFLMMRRLSNMILKKSGKKQIFLSLGSTPGEKD